MTDEVMDAAEQIEAQLKELTAPLVALRDEAETQLNEMELRRSARVLELDKQKQEVNEESKQEKSEVRERLRRINRTLETLDPSQRKSMPNERKSPKSGAYTEPPEELMREAIDWMENRENKDFTAPEMNEALGWTHGRSQRVIATIRETPYEGIVLMGKQRREQGGRQARLYRYTGITETMRKEILSGIPETG